MMLGPAWLERTLGQVSRARVAAYGDFALDAYWELDPDKTETSLETGKPVQKIRSQRYGLGAAGNVAANLASLGVASVHAIGLIGQDLFGDHLLQQLATRGIETGSMLRTQADWQTPVFAKPQLGGEEQSRIDFGAFNSLTVASFERLRSEVERAAHNCEIVILNQQIPVGLSTPQAIEGLNEVIARFPPRRFLVDSRHRPEQYRGAMLKVNESEARRMLGSSARGEDLLRELYARVERTVFVTRGAKGMGAAADGQVYTADGIAVASPTDTVGAGDTALAAIAAAIGGGADLSCAIQFANLAAAVTVAKVQTTGTATAKEIRALAIR